MKRDNDVFALDIGTRNVVGIIAEMQEGSIVVRHVEQMEHKVRSMLDGQIHDVNLVASVVENVKEELEKQVGKRLKKVAVAVAGRALKTVNTEAAMRISLEKEITEEQVNSLDFLALRNALNIVGHGRGVDFHCVGYSVLGYFLDGEPILNPVGQKGTSLKVQMIATFLPRVVIDSMLSVLNRCKLKLVNVNLEPVAAANLVVPPDMRKLNLALVDIGAGTSDIAVSKDGKIVGYGMVPMAGDEITEKICERYLVDFNEGEKIKRLLSSQEEIEFTDILGNNYTFKSVDILKDIDNELSSLANLIADEIIKINGGQPAAVMCIGGGSQVPGLAKKISEALEIPGTRVRVVDINRLSIVEDITGKIKGPEMITPVGIALTSLKEQAFRFVDVWVNNEPVRLLALTDIRVIDALLAAGISKDSFRVQHGEAITIELNGKVKIFKGELGIPPQITVNGKPSVLNALINSGDRIKLKRAVRGKDAVVTVYDAVGKGLTPITIYINGVMHEVQPMVLVDGKVANMNQRLNDRAKVVVRRKIRVSELLDRIGTKLFGEYMKVTVNGKVHYLQPVEVDIMVNGKPASMDTEVSSGDSVEVSNSRKRVYRVKDVIGDGDMEPATIIVSVNGERIELPYGSRSVTLNGSPASLEDVLKDGDVVEVGRTSGEPILSHVLKFVDIDKKSSGRLRMLVNGKDAKFTTPLRDGDRVEIFFE